jgi:probable rRNA maturation factor
MRAVVADTALEVDILVESPLWSGQEEGLVRALVHAAKSENVTGEVSLLLGDDAAIAVLNREWRGKEGPTNVLSFPAAAPAQGLLGDIALAAETIVTEANSQGKAFPAHAAHLAVHGFLHLLGYDHETAPEAEAMEERERVILRALGIADPYA